MAQNTELVDFVCGELAQRADRARAQDMAAYMRTGQPFYGVARPYVNTIAKQARRRFVPASPAAYKKNVLALWRLPQRDAQYVAIEYAKQPAFILPTAIPLYERMVREGAWWDLVDDISANLVGIVYLHHRKVAQPVLDRWIGDPDFWIRRAALLSQLRRTTHTDARHLFGYCLKCAHEKEFFIRKAIGWALREYSKNDPQAVKAFLIQNRKKLSPLSLREGAKHLIRIGKLKPLDL